MTTFILVVFFSISNQAGYTGTTLKIENLSSLQDCENTATLVINAASQNPYWQRPNHVCLEMIEAAAPLSAAPTKGNK